MMRSLFLAFLLLPVTTFAAFPSAQTSQADGWAEAVSISASVKSRANSLRTQMTTGNVRAISIINTAVRFYDARQRFDSLKTIPGIQAYARDQLDDQTINLNTEFNAMISAINAFVEGVKTAVPEDAGGYAQIYSVTGGTNAITLTAREFTPAQTTTLRTLLQAIENSIN